MTDFNLYVWYLLTYHNYLQWPLPPLLYLDIQYTAGNSKLGHEIIIFLALKGLKTKGIYAPIFQKKYYKNYGNEKVSPGKKP